MCWFSLHFGVYDQKCVKPSVYALLIVCAVVINNSYRLCIWGSTEFSTQGPLLCSIHKESEDTPAVFTNGLHWFGQPFYLFWGHFYIQHTSLYDNKKTIMVMNTILTRYTKLFIEVEHWVLQNGIMKIKAVQWIRTKGHLFTEWCTIQTYIHT